MDLLKVLPQYLLPQHTLTALMYRLTRIQHPYWKNIIINAFIRSFNVDMAEACFPVADDYQSFNDFFTRKLKAGARHWHNNTQHILSPVDGAVSELGEIKNETVFQAKGKLYSLSQLLANDLPTAKRFRHGCFATLYLSPRDYHRIHMPLTGHLLQTRYIPGKLFAVNNSTVRTINALFARNERLVSLFKTDAGHMALIMVGAFFVGSMETIFAGEITPRRHRELETIDYANQNITLKQGSEFGHFNMGSTVILLFEENRMDWLSEFCSGTTIQVGQQLGQQRTD